MQFRFYFLYAGPFPVAILYALEAWVVVLYALQLYHSEMDEVPRSAVNGVVCSSLSFSCLHFFSCPPPVAVLYKCEDQVAVLYAVQLYKLKWMMKFPTMCHMLLKFN